MGLMELGIHWFPDSTVCNDLLWFCWGSLRSILGQALQCNEMQCNASQYMHYACIYQDTVPLLEKNVAARILDLR